MASYKVTATLTDDMLGTLPGNRELHAEYVASRSQLGKKSQQEEAEAIEEVDIEKLMTVFPRKEGQPFIYDYQIKGFFKEAVLAMIEAGLADYPGNVKPNLTRYTYKRVIDNGLFITPRQIIINMPKKAVIGHCQRPIRCETTRGERTSLAHSETVPEGSTFDFTVNLLNPRLEMLMHQCLEYGQHKGLGQWRNSGKGRFCYTIDAAKGRFGYAAQEVKEPPAQKAPAKAKRGRPRTGIA